MGDELLGGDRLLRGEEDRLDDMRKSGDLALGNRSVKGLFGDRLGDFDSLVADLFRALQNLDGLLGNLRFSGDLIDFGCRGVDRLGGILRFLFLA